MSIEDSSADNDLVTIRSCRDNGEANVLRSVLKDAEILAFLQGENHRSLLGAMGPYIELRILVRAQDAPRAKEIRARADPADSDATEDRVFRVRQKRGRTNPVPAILGGICAIYLLSEGHWIVGAVTGTLSVLLLAGALLVKKNLGGRCSTPSCNTFIPGTAPTCPGCGGKVVGVIQHENERLRALEDLSSSSPTPPLAD